MKRPVSLWTQIAPTSSENTNDINPDDTPLQESVPEKIDVEQATEQSQSSRIGDYFIESGRLSKAKIEAIVDKQNSENMRFGDAAVALGLLSKEEVQQALSKQYHYPIASADAALAGFPIAHAPHTAEAEAIRKIRTQLLLRLDAQKTQTIAIISPNKGEGKSYVATSLALAFAQNGQRTLLINANLREAQHSGMLDNHRLQGLSSVLSKRSSLSQCLISTSFAKLHLLDAGPLPPNPTELLLPPALKNIFTSVTDQFDIIILDTPSIGLFPDAQLIAQQTNACLIVARQHRTLLKDLRKTKRMTQTAGGVVIGSIFNTFEDPQETPNPSRWVTNQLRLWRKRLLNR